MLVSVARHASGAGVYLDLAQLRVFMAHEMKTPLARLNVMVGVAKLEHITKRDPDFAP